MDLPRVIDAPQDAQSGAAHRDLVFVLPHLGPGGAQRVAVLLLGYWHQRGLRPAALTLYENPDAYRLEPGILREDFAREAGNADPGGWLARLYLRVEARLSEEEARSRSARAQVAIHALLSAWRGIRSLRARVLQRLSPRRAESYTQKRVRWLRSRFQSMAPRVIVSFVGSTNIMTLIAARELDARVVISERNDPALQRLEPPWEGLRPRIYPEADIVTANSAGALRTMSAYVPAERLRQVANPLSLQPCPASGTGREPRLILVARLVRQKAADVLIAAFARIVAEAPDWRLDIVGDGPLRTDLERQAGSLGISSLVRFHGYVSDPVPLLCRASIFVLPSRFEGMPNSMLEAMACGLPVVVSDASPGPLELIRHAETGLVFPVDDAAGLAGAVCRLITDAPLRERLALAAQEIAAGMALPVVAAKWEAILREVGLDLAESATR